MTIHYLVSGMTSPSSTQAMLVVVAPISTTHPFDMPAPYVAASDSYVSVRNTRTPRNGRCYLLNAKLLEAHGHEQHPYHALHVDAVIEIRDNQYDRVFLIGL